MKHFVFEATDEHATDRLGAALAAVVPAGATIALTGTLGAGKTRLVQAIAAACGVDREEVVSPTFVLSQRYESGTKIIHHLDAYRLRDEDEFLELGVDEMFASEAITLVEWADKVLDCLPADRLEIEIEPTGETSRRFTVGLRGTRLKGTLEQIVAVLTRR